MEPFDAVARPDSPPAGDHAPAEPVVSGRLTVEIRTADDMRRLGRRLAARLRAGDLVLLRGALGAGKTTLAQGMGDGLDVRGPITSPTFVLARVHPALSGGPPLVHVDAYRLGTVADPRAEVDDLDLDAVTEDAGTAHGRLRIPAAATGQPGAAAQGGCVPPAD